MVRALLNGTKTQTRRVVKLKSWQQIEERDDGSPWPWMHNNETGDDAWLQCPYGQPGDRLWVRETSGLQVRHDRLGGTGQFRVYRASNPNAIREITASGNATPIKWVSSIHMPRWASRITLEIISVRVERLQDISEADARAEGCEPLDSEREDHDWSICPQCGGTRLFTSFGSEMGARPDTDCGKCDTYAKRYRHLWESINGAGSWGANPWVWAVEFKRVEQSA